MDWITNLVPNIYLLGTLIGLGIFIILYLYKNKHKIKIPKKTKKNNPKHTKEDDHDDHDDHHGSSSSSKPVSTAKKIQGWVELILVIALAIGVCFWVYSKVHNFVREESHANERPYYVSSPVNTKELLEPMGEGMVGPNTTWVTNTVDYKFKFRTDGHAYNLQFSKVGGGWTNPISFPKEGNIDFSVPNDATQGPVLVTAGLGEVGQFKVQLYKRIVN